MQSASISMASMCQGSRLLGMSKSDEHTLESYLRRLTRNNGPEFVIDKLKSLKLQTIRCLEDQHYVMPKDQVAEGYTSTAWSRSKQQPKGELSIIYKTWSSPSKRVRGIGMLINTIKLEDASDKQIQKLMDGINVDNSFADKDSLLVTREEARTFVESVNHHLDNQPLYDGTDLTGSLIPDGNRPVSISEAKKGLTSSDPKIRHDSQAKLSWAYDDQWKMAPRITTNYIRQNFLSFNTVRVHKNTGLAVRDYDYHSVKKRFYRIHAYGRNSLQAKDYAGTVSFLQKPGGKLRSVFNTNRVINYSLKPYAKGLEDAFYHRHPHHIFVKRQDKGMESISRMLQRGHELTSADLTSATDRLNFRTFTNGLRRSIFSAYFSKENLKELRQSDRDFFLKKNPDTRRKQISYLFFQRESKPFEVEKALNAIDYFESIAELPFYSDDLGMAVALKTGQPLGAMGSFQTLTAMNFCMGREAEIISHNTFSEQIPQFAVVGDDFVGDSSIMKNYSNIVKSSGGLDNHEKALHSDRYAEFCSHLITSHRIVPMKPRFHLGSYSVWLDAGKTSLDKSLKVYKLSDSDKESLSALSAYGDPSLSEISVPSSSQKYPKEERLYIENALKQMSFESQVSPDPISISRETEDYSRDAAQHRPDVGSGKSDFRIYHDTDNGREFVGYSHQVSSYNDRKYSTVIDHYDHHVGDRRVKQSVRKAALQNKKRGQIVSKLHDAYVSKHGSDIDLGPMPYHDSSRISADNLMLNAIDSEEKTSSLMSHPMHRVIKRLYAQKDNPGGHIRTLQKKQNMPHSTKSEPHSDNENGKKNCKIHNTILQTRPGSSYPNADLSTDYNNPIDRSRNRLADNAISNRLNGPKNHDEFKIKPIPTPWDTAEEKDREDSPDF